MEIYRLNYDQSVHDFFADLSCLVGFAIDSVEQITSGVGVSDYGSAGGIFQKDTLYVDRRDMPGLVSSSDVGFVIPGHFGADVEDDCEVFRLSESLGEAAEQLNEARFSQAVYLLGMKEDHVPREECNSGSIVSIGTRVFGHFKNLNILQSQESMPDPRVSISWDHEAGKFLVKYFSQVTSDQKGEGLAAGNMVSLGGTSKINEGSFIGALDEIHILRLQMAATMIVDAANVILSVTRPKRDSRPKPSDVYVESNLLVADAVDFMSSLVIPNLIVIRR